MADEWGTPLTDQKQFESVTVVDPTDAVIGVYRGYHVVKGNFGPTKLHHIEDANGDILGLWGTGVLDYHLEGHDNHRVKVLKTGRKIDVKGGNRAWEYLIWCATCSGNGSQTAPPKPADEEPPF